MNKTTVNRFYSTTTALTTMTFQIDFSRPTPALCEGSNHRVSLHLEAYIPVECALERFLCWLQIKGLRRENYQVQGVYWLLQKECAVNPPHGVMGGFGSVGRAVEHGFAAAGEQTFGAFPDQDEVELGGSRVG